MNPLFQFSSSPPPAPSPRMRVVIPCMTFIGISISVMFFYGNFVSHPCPQAAADAFKASVAEPYTLSMPPCNCNCSVFYAENVANPSLAATPSLYCQCQENSGIGPNVTLAGPKPSTPEPQIVEKTVIKEVAKECPKVDVQVVEKEVIKEVEMECPRVPWYAKNRSWHYPASFPLCSMDTCFDWSRCDNANELLIYTYYSPIPPPRFFANINESKYHTDDPSKACLFLAPFDNPDPWNFQNIKNLPYWNGGLNHLVLTFSDKYGRLAPTGDDLGNASIIASDLQETMYRPGFDVSVPFPANFHIRQFQSVSALDRRYLATFRGLRYLGYTDDGVFRSAKEFRELHNGKDVIVATTCEHPTNDWHRKENPELGADCDADKAQHAQYDFVDLMNTTFAFVPAGRQPASYRFIEVLSAGAVPVLIADNYVKPFDSIIPWYTCVIQYPTTEIQRIDHTLRSISDDEKLKRQKNCLRIYEEYLKDDETLLRSTVRSLKARFLGSLPNLSEIGNRRR